MEIANCYFRLAVNVQVSEAVIAIDHLETFYAEEAAKGFSTLKLQFKVSKFLN